MTPHAPPPPANTLLQPGELIVYMGTIPRACWRGLRRRRRRRSIRRRRESGQSIADKKWQRYMNEVTLVGKEEHDGEEKVEEEENGIRVKTKGRRNSSNKGVK